VKTTQQEIQQTTKKTFFKLAQVLFLLFLCILLFIGFFLGLNCIIGKNLFRVHPDEMEIRDWIIEKHGSWEHSVGERRIRSVSLDAVNLTKEDFKRLTGLTEIRHLILDHVNITDELLHVRELKSLHYIEINGVVIGCDDFQKLEELLPLLQQGYLSNSSTKTEIKNEKP